jgi:AcrR family transcriptional regulator
LPSDTKKSQQILSCGIKVFAKKGFHAANVEDLIDAAGVSRATFYAHYKNKEDLFTEIVDYILQEESAFILKIQQELLNSSSNIIVGIEEIISKVIKESGKNRDAMIFFFDVIPGSGTRAEERFRKMQKITLEHFTTMIRRHMESMGFSSSAALALAYLLIGGMNYIGRMVIYGEIPDAEMQNLIDGMKELLNGRLSGE